MSRSKRGMNRTALKRGVDLLLTAALLALMPYSLVGEAAHEWIGMGMLLLLSLHLALNRTWLQNLGRGRYSPYRTLQTVLAASCLLIMLSLTASGILVSEVLFPDVRIRGWTETARMVHLAGSFWGFVVMSLHLGLHWTVILKAVRRFAVTRTRGFRALGVLIALYGIYAFGKRDFFDYLFLRTHFLFLNYEEPVLLFFLDYLAVMGLFVFCAHYGTRLLPRKNKYMKEVDQP